MGRWQSLRLALCGAIKIFLAGYQRLRDLNVPLFEGDRVELHCSLDIRKKQ